MAVPSDSQLRLDCCLGTRRLHTDLLPSSARHLDPRQQAWLLVSCDSTIICPSQLSSRSYLILCTPYIAAGRRRSRGHRALDRMNCAAPSRACNRFRCTVLHPHVSRLLHKTGTSRDLVSGVDGVDGWREMVPQLVTEIDRDDDETCRGDV